MENISSQLLYYACSWMINHSSQTIFIQANDLLKIKVWRFISVKEVHTVTFWWSRNHDRFRHSPKGCNNYNRLSQKWEFQNFLALNLRGLLVPISLFVKYLFVFRHVRAGKIVERHSSRIQGKLTKYSW